MQDRELVAAIAAGDPDGLAEAYDRYVAQLYTYCRLMLPDPHPPGAAADAVADTFIVAAAKLQLLRDPERLGSWLQAVARAECLRRLGSADPARPATARLALPADDALPEASPPDSLRERVLQESADNTPTGRAHRVSVVHRAGSFGRRGFPKPVIPPGPRWWHEVRQHPRAAAGVAAVAAAVVVAGVSALLLAGGSHRAQASTVALGGATFGSASPASSPAGGQSLPSGRPAPARRASSTPASSAASASPAAPASLADGPTAGHSPSPGPPGSSRSAPPSAPPSRSPSPAPSPSPSPPPPPPPVQGTLQVTPDMLVLAAPKGKPASGTFVLTAVGGPVSFVIRSPGGKVIVSPSSGSLGSGASITVTVTVRSKVAVNVHLIVDPGDLVLIVAFSIKV
jgi:DNA-directed RNA polymerase specialized sigma24 family protein